MRKSINQILSLLLAVTFFAPAQGYGQEERPAIRTVEIIKFVTHPALDATETGVVDRLRKLEGDTHAYQLEIHQRNAKGNPQLAKSLAERASRGETDLIIAIATPAAQAVARTPSDIPLLYGAVSDPEGAGILASGRATGIKNVGPGIIETALRFMRTAFPRATRLGTIYNPGEQNSAYVQGILKSLVKEYGFEYDAVPVHDATHVAQAAEVLAQRTDILYSANDNTVNSAVAAVVGVADKFRLPFILGDLSTLESGALAAVGLDYYEMGQAVGVMAFRLLTGETLQSLPPREPPAPAIWLNEGTRQRLNIEMPPGVEALIDARVGG